MASPAAAVVVGLEPPPPVHKPFDLAPDGAPVFRPDASADRQLGILVRRIWHERGGIHDVTEHALAATAAASLAPADGSGAAGRLEHEQQQGQEQEQEQEQATADDVPPLDLDGMRAFKTEVWEQLEQAKHALGNFHHVLTLLLPPSLTVPSAPDAAPPNPQTQLPAYIPLPPSALSTTVVARPPFAAGEDARALLLAQKQADLRHTAAQLAREAGALAEVVRRDREECALALRTRREGWAMALRNVRDGQAALGGKRDERDWAAWYALDNAPNSLRARHIAHLPPPTSVSPAPPSAAAAATAATAAHLLHPARTHKRLRVSIERSPPGGGGGGGPADVVFSRVRVGLGGSGEPEGEGQVLEECMRETVDEEVFNEVMTEARQSPLLRPSRMTATTVVLDVTSDVALVVELVDARTLDPDAPWDAQATLLHTSLTSSLLALHAYRRQALRASLLPLRDPSRPPVLRPRFLAPAVDGLQFACVQATVGGLLARFQEGARRWGGRVDVAWSEGEGAKDRRWKRCTVGFSRSLDAGAPSIGADPAGAQDAVLTLVAPSRIYLALPAPSATGVSAAAGARAQTALRDAPHAAGLLRALLQACVVRNAVRLVGGGSGAGDMDSEELGGSGGGERRKTCVFPDDGKGLAVLQCTKGQMLVKPTVTLGADGTPALELRADVRRAGQAAACEELLYTSGAEGAQAASAWLADRWRELAG